MKGFHAFCVVLLIFGSVSEAKFDDFEDDEDETTVELEGQDESQEGDFEDADTQVKLLFH